MLHKIKKQVFELSIDKEQEAFSLQQKMKDHFYFYCIPVLEKEFDKVSRADEVFVIDKLEIDLGSIPAAELKKSVLSMETIRQITEIITEAVSKYLVSSEVKPVKRSLKENSFEQWMFYMKKGYLPWNSFDTGKNWHDEVLEILATDFNSISELRNEINKNDAVVTRIINQHPAAFLVTLAETLTSQKQKDLPKFINELVFLKKHVSGKSIYAYKGHSSGETENDRKMVAQIWKHIISLSAQEEKGNTAKEIAKKIITLYYPEVRLISANEMIFIRNEVILLYPLIRQIQDDNLEKTPSRKGTELSKSKKLPGEPNLDLKDTGNKNAAILNEEKDNVVSDEDKESGSGINSVSATGDTKLPVQESSFTDGSAGEVNLEMPPEIAVQKIDEEGIFVRQAGLILTHPFLQSLFRLTGLVNGKQFVSESAREKALYILHYAATGNANANEHDLVVAKILCGFDIEKPVSRDIEISPVEKQQADDMLRAVIAQWNILKSTSPDGLREGFLKRNGKILTKNGNLYFQVEKESIDVLLDYLPWNLSLVKVPWLNELIRVEWR